ncbi:hypothetical protein [Nocardiopsis halophila]|uniref:hypothetical protein n=1 Tax=Nocardiopsis halophila TaxID=141692 RepID=UPI00034B52EC|nr:hypothetical protein [Nocardiopsis halophila]
MRIPRSATVLGAALALAVTVPAPAFAGTGDAPPSVGAAVENAPGPPESAERSAEGAGSLSGAAAPVPADMGEREAGGTALVSGEASEEPVAEDDDGFPWMAAGAILLVVAVAAFRFRQLFGGRRRAARSEDPPA